MCSSTNVVRPRHGAHAACTQQAGAAVQPRDGQPRALPAPAVGRGRIDSRRVRTGQSKRGRLEPHQPGDRPAGLGPHLDRRQPQPTVMEIRSRPPTAQPGGDLAWWSSNFSAHDRPRNAETPGRGVRDSAGSILARELECRWCAVAAVRGLELRAAPAPMLADLRESGSIERTRRRDVIYRDDVYHTIARPGQAEIIVAKHRNGPTACAAGVPRAVHPLRNMAKVD